MITADLLFITGYQALWRILLITSHSTNCIRTCTSCAQDGGGRVLGWSSSYQWAPNDLSQNRNQGAPLQHDVLHPWDCFLLSQWIWPCLYKSGRWEDILFKFQSSQRLLFQILLVFESNTVEMIFCSESQSSSHPFFFCNDVSTRWRYRRMSKNLSRGIINGNHGTFRIVLVWVVPQ